MRSLAIGHALLVLAAGASVLAGCAASRAATEDGGARASGEDVDVVGTWRDCHTTIVFAPDGTSRMIDHRRGCSATGHWQVDGSTLIGAIDATDCEGLRAGDPRQVVRAGRGLLMIDPETGAVSRYADEATPHALWRFEDATRATLARIVGDPAEAFGAGCYWSEDEACGGLFSCSGSIGTWRVEDGVLRGSALCGGDCPCSVTIEGVPEDDGSFAATYRGANCDRIFDGTFTARRLPEP